MRDDQDYTLAGYASHLGGVIDHLGIKRVHLGRVSRMRRC